MSRDAEVSPEAVERLLALVRDRGVDLDAWGDLFSASACAPFMRLYKLDVSVSLHADSAPRVSVNDTGEPEAFRKRLRALCGDAAPAAVVDRFLALCPAGLAQTTISVKWESSLRTTLYFEELVRHPDAEGLREALVSEFGGGSSTALTGPLMALAVDICEGRPVAVKEYRHGDLVQTPKLAPSLVPLFRVHPHTGQTRVLVATRWGVDGEALGDKVLWVTEANTPRLAAATWRHLAGLVHRLGYEGSDAWTRVRTFVERWPFGPDVVPYPDLVSVNRDASGQVEDLILYISLK